jgi:hypothetical protein
MRESEFWNALDLLEDDFNRMPKEMQNSPIVIRTFTIGALALLLLLRENEGKNTKFLLEVFLALIMTNKYGRHALFYLPGDKVHHNQQDAKRQYIKAFAAAVLEHAYSDEGGNQALWGERIASGLGKAGFCGSAGSYSGGAIIKWRSDCIKSSTLTPTYDRHSPVCALMRSRLPMLLKALL